MRDLVRPSHLARSGWRAARVAFAMVAASLVLALGAFAASSLYGQYGAPRADANAVAWADRVAVYSVTGCRDCHREQAAAETASAHVDVICQTCHVPAVAHPGNVSGVIQALGTQTSAICVTCHVEAAGRPIAFPQVDPGEHYPGAICLQCHDPHTAAAQSPPEVSHPLEKLPACTTCHAPDGLKRIPAGHQPASDGVCLNCHRTREWAP